MAASPHSNQPRRRKRRFYKRPGFWLALFLLGVGAGIAGWMTADVYTRPYRERAATYDLERINDLEVPSLILDRNGKEIGRFFVQNRSIIDIDQVPQIFLDVLRAGEDSRFLKHKGVDFIGVVRAAKLTFQGSSQGASTITQQLARNAYNLKAEAVQRKESTFQRKLVEMFLAMRIEKRYTKQQILEFYLNRIYFGSGFYGIRSASLGYFGKEPMDLTVEECASLVTLIKNPTERSPLNYPETNRRGRDYVLGRMEKENLIDKREMRRLQALPLVLHPKPLRRGTTHLYERIAEAVGRELGEDTLASGGFTIHTTILAEAQDASERALAASLARAEAHPGYTRQKYAEYRRGSGQTAEYLQGAVLMMDHQSGEVLAYVGGRDYSQVPYDFIEQGKRPLGTAFFPFVYAAGLSGGQTPATLVEDEPMDNRAVMVGGREGILGEWGMEVPTPVYEGNVPIRRALESSKIAATVRFANQVGLPRIVDVATAFGLPMEQAELLPRLAVGWESTSMKQAVRAISAFARGGQLGAAQLVLLDRVVDAQGKTRYRRNGTPAPSPRAVDEATVWQVHNMMADSLVRGSAAGALEGLIETPFPGAGKGGTTHDFSDTWFLGYNQRVTCGVWTGFLQGAGEPIYPGAFSRDLSLPVWQAAMNAIAPSFGGGTIAPPDNVVPVQVCRVSGQRATPFCQEHEAQLETGSMRSVSTAMTEYFRKGTENLPFCTVHSGAFSDSLPSDMAISNLPALDAAPVLPKEPTLLGDDPYHTELPSVTASSDRPGFSRRRTNVLDSLDLGERDEQLRLPFPKRLTITDE